jgi:hypothetical protein
VLAGPIAVLFWMTASVTVALAQPPRVERDVGQASKRILSTEIAAISGNASLKLEFDDHRVVELAIRNGQVLIDGRPAGNADSGGELDRSWRALLERALNQPTESLGGTLVGWSPPANDPAGAALDAAIESALAGVPIIAPAITPEPGDAQISDSVNRLVDRIAELEAQLEDLEQEVEETPPGWRDRFEASPWLRPFVRIWRSLVGVFAILIVGGILFAIGLAVIFFGGRQYIEGVADTARSATSRSLFVGMAASFLALPAYALGVVALAISIVGIPALLLWVPLFPVALVLAVVLGYLGVGHAAGESLAERRFYGGDWFRHGNSYYFLVSGLALLLAPFIAVQLVAITGIGFLTGLLIALAAVVTWAAASVGLGAVLISRAGTRPIRTGGGTPSEPEVYAEEAHV